MSYRHVITELIESHYRQENEALTTQVAHLELSLAATQRALRHAQEQLAASERTRQDLSTGLANIQEYADLQQSRVTAYTLGIENYIHLTYEAEVSLLLEQLTLSFRREGIDLGDLLEDPERTDDEEDIHMRLFGEE